MIFPVKVNPFSSMTTRVFLKICHVVAHDVALAIQ